MNEAINQTSFENLQKIEAKEGFDENPTNESFFRKGKKGEWKKKLSSDNIKKIETKFFKEMKELGYL